MRDRIPPTTPMVIHAFRAAGKRATREKKESGCIQLWGEAAFIVNEATEAFVQ